MPDTPTPGQVAYEAFWVNDLPDFRGDAWEKMDHLTRRRWEAAAQAVLADGLGHILAREAAAIRQVGALIQTVCTPGTWPELARAIAALQPWLNAHQEHTS